MKKQVCCVILAAGEGKRMKSDKPKVMSEVLEKPMLYYVIKSCIESGCEDICVVTGFKGEIIKNYLSEYFPDIYTAEQNVRLGTAHAVMCAKDFLKKHKGHDVFVLNGDAPFIDKDTLDLAYDKHKQNKNSATVISAKVDDPSGYGRIVRSKTNNEMLCIIEDKDTTDEQKLINEVSSGAYVFDLDSLLDSLEKINNNNSQGEYYLPDAIAILLNSGKKVDAVISKNPNTVLGANDRKQLLELNEIAKNLFAT